MFDKILDLFSDGTTANMIAFVALLISGRQEYSARKQKKADDTQANIKEREQSINMIENSLETLVIVENKNINIARYKAAKISDQLSEFCKKYQLSTREVMIHYSTIFNYATNDGLDREASFEPFAAIRVLITLLKESSSDI